MKFNKLLIFMLAIIIMITAVFPAIPNNVIFAKAGNSQYGDINISGDNIVKDENSEDENIIGQIVSGIILTFSSNLYTMTAALFGRPVTYETIIFNQIPTLNLNIFTNMKGEQNDYVHPIAPGGTKTIGDHMNELFKFFSSIAIIAYMIIIVYMGVRILLGTGAKTGAKYKELIIYWIEGVAILFFFPYVMKYTIELNDMFVAFIYENKNITYGSNTSNLPSTPTNVGKTSFSGMLGANANAIRYLTDENNSDFMSQMFRVAFKNGWIVFAFCWAIMVKQVLALIVIYFKRLLTTIFLVSIFPLVTISYAIDKIADGKSQAFGNWYKEFVLNVMTNSFHAVVYVLGMGLILEIGASNWFLTMLLIEFISKGDEMLRGIFGIKGGGGDTVKGIGKTILAAKGAQGLVKGARKIADKVAGPESKLAALNQARGNGMNRLYAWSSSRNQAKMDDIEQTEMKREHLAKVVESGTTEAVTTAINDLTRADATEEERQKAAETLAYAMNSPDATKRDELVQKLKSSGFTDEQLALITALAATVGRNVQVNFNQDIELILKGMRKDKNGKRVASVAEQALARELARKHGINSDEEIDKLEKLKDVRFRKPPEKRRRVVTDRRKRGTERKGDRYSGTFRNIPAIQNRDKAADEINEASKNAKMSRGKKFRMSVANKAAYLAHLGSAKRKNQKENADNPIRRMANKKKAERAQRAMNAGNAGRSDKQESLVANRLRDDLDVIRQRGAFNSETRADRSSNKKKAGTETDKTFASRASERLSRVGSLIKNDFSDFNSMVADERLRLDDPKEYARMQREKQAIRMQGQVSPLEGFAGYMGTGDNGFGPAPRTAYGKGIPLNGNRYSTAQGTTQRKEVVFRNGDVSYDGDILVLNSVNDRKKAKGFVDDAIASAKKAARTNGTKQVDTAPPEIYSLAESVVALNSPEGYTASEMVAHIDNIRNMMSAIRKNGSSSANDQMEAIMKKLNYDLEDFDSNLRIQIINDPSLISQNDPNRNRIMDSSIHHVQSMSDEDILLSTLRYNRDSLQVGQEPGAVGTVARYESPFEARLRELNEHKEAAIATSEEARKEFAAFAKEFAKDAISVGADLTIGMPIAVAGGLISMGISSSSSDGDIFSFDALNTGLAGMSLGESAYDLGKKVVSGPVNLAKGVGKSVADEVSRVMAAVPPEATYVKPKVTGFIVKDSSTEGQVIVTVNVDPGSYDIVRYSFKSDDGREFFEGDAVQGQLTFSVKVPKETRMTFEVYDGKTSVSADITAV